MLSENMRIKDKFQALKKQAGKSSNLKRVALSLAHTLQYRSVFFFCSKLTKKSKFKLVN
ncbi:hypothetical protein SPI02_01380 [Staphylococcus piscifermentans]|uniref:Uncharacterized protein n=1 Tax=Staphylococcus piscifermentans TaxID=70258 RepID=A0A512QJE0_9STAP|nr:hypothetical protein SPI02_01380 [Staphylococcus piscifermentans]